MSIPISTTPGRQGFGPQLALTYDSGSGNSPFGWGWSLAVPAVTRKTEKGIPRYVDREDDTNVPGDSDTFVLSGAEDLVPWLVWDGARWVADRFESGGYVVRRYRPRVEGLFARIERWWHRDTGDVHWRSTTRENLTSIFGASAEFRIADPQDPRRVFSWLLQESRDGKGNIVAYEYAQENAVGVDFSVVHERNRRLDPALSPEQQIYPQRYLKAIRYGNRASNADPSDDAQWCFKIVLDYGDHLDPTPSHLPDGPWSARQDPFSVYRPGFELRSWRLCRRFLMFHNFAELGPQPVLVRSTEFAFAEAARGTFLISATQKGWAPVEGGYEAQVLPAVTFEYTESSPGAVVQNVEPDSLAHLPVGLDGRAYQFVDLDGEGVSGILSEQGGAWFYKRNIGTGRFAPVEVVARTPSPSSLTGGQPQLTQLAADGRLQLVQRGGTLEGYQERTRDGEWGPFTPFRQGARLDWSDPNVRFVDVDGDGLVDLLISENEVFRWHPSLGREGHGPAEWTRKPRDEEKGPALVFADAEQSIFLADMSGDGLTDIVRIRNGAICYWPNLGYGRFGAKVALSGAPRFDRPDLFRPDRIRLADIDGTGTTDVLYLGRDAVRFWRNHSGNVLGEEERLAAFPRVDDVSSVQVADLLGTGTSCLVWSSPLASAQPLRMRYVDLSGGVKPNLLKTVRNHLGAVTSIEYAPSTRFYLEDRLAGTPWLTRLPFPVQVVSRVEVVDEVSGTSVVHTYRYRHGYYDAEEREFRGFGCVEQRDAETLPPAMGAGVFDEDASLTLPPVVTRSWFHTGAWFEDSIFSTQFAKEYYSGDALAVPLADSEPSAPADPALPHELSAREQQEARRALAGQLLRQEVYAEDGTPEQAHPYVVTESRYGFRRLQPRQGDTPAVFFVHPLEALSHHYERDPDDPRTTHQLTLAVDDWGQVRRAAQVAYARRTVPVGMPEQGRVPVVVAETDVLHVTTESAWFRVGAPWENRAYELSGASPGVEGRFSVAGLAGDIQEVLDGAADTEQLPYEGTPTPGLRSLRLLERSRTQYLEDDLTGPLPRGQVESLALVYETQQLAFTDGLLAVYEGRVTYGFLTDEGGYSFEDGVFWIPSGRPTYDPSLFYQVAAYTDPFAQTTTVAYDADALAVVSVTDPLGNQTLSATDYRVMAPWMVTDPNGNRQAVRFDALGRVTAWARMGKEGSSEGDTLSEPAEGHALYDPFGWVEALGPEGGLGVPVEEGATAYFEYDPDAWTRDGTPAVAHVREREVHDDPATPWRHSWVYTDGLGREAMTKVEAAPYPDGSPRYVGTGRTVFDNKGNPVKQYEPFFSDTSAFEDEDALVTQGVTPILRYDPLGRRVRTDLPNGTFASVEQGPWRTVHRDGNDHVEGSRWERDRDPAQNPAASPEDQDARTKALAHEDTPTEQHLDPQGRVFLTRQTLVSGADPEVDGDWLPTRLELDIEGNPWAVVDPLGHRTEQVFDVAGRPVHTDSPDAGRSWVLPDIAGEPVRTWDARDFMLRWTRDALRRPLGKHVTPPGGTESQAERFEHGEQVLPDADARARNLRGRLYRTYDGAGLLTHEEYDFKGNLLRQGRRLTLDPTTEPDWSVGDPEALLEAETFTTTRTYDALDRVAGQATPDGSLTVYRYDEGRRLRRVQVNLRGSPTPTVFVDSIQYDPKGRRTAITYGNGVVTTYTYDPETFALRRILTERPSDGAVLQDLNYTYDPSGNVTDLRDAVAQDVYFDGGMATPGGTYTYDALYRLVQATGREHAGQNSAPPSEIHVPALLPPDARDGTALRDYTQTYAYDAAGNITSLDHLAEDGTHWIRTYAYEVGSNRLASTTIGATTVTYTHDPSGNMTAIAGSGPYDWDGSGRLRHVDLQGGGDAWHGYDASGQRVRKVVFNDTGAIRKERIYLGGYEIYRYSTGAGLQDERETLHVMDDQRRIALVETLTREGGDAVAAPVPVQRYQFGNLLDSSCLELDGVGAVISYEEYHPYGTSSYRSASAAEVSEKRYRYTGKEKDEETGLYYHGARYYACWLGRWVHR